MGSLDSAYERLKKHCHLSRTLYREATALGDLAGNMLGNARMRVCSARRALGAADPADKRGILRLHRSLSDCARLLADTAAQYAEAENSGKEAARHGREADALACGMHRHFPDRRFALAEPAALPPNVDVCRVVPAAPASAHA